MDIILQHKHAIQIKKEGALALGGSTLGGTLYLAEEGLIFSTQENLIDKICNSQKVHGVPLPNSLKKNLLEIGPLKDCLVMTLDEIERAETGGFKQLGIVMTPTLRLYLKDGKKYIFIVADKETADKFVSEISRLIGQG